MSIKATKEQQNALAGIKIDSRYEPDMNDADRLEVITADGRLAIIDIDGDVEYQEASGWMPA